MAAQPFWKRKTLAQMSTQEWESLCDGCAKCCLQKLEDEDSGEVFYTRVVCQYLSDNCRCTVYQERQQKVPNCVWLKPEDVDQFFWLPSTCAYRLIAEGEDLPEWHPLMAQDSQRIHAVDASVLHLAPVRDNEVPEEDWEDYIIDNV
ncbi:YcgN family cysteine cluster protein [Saccharospirillum impatiens]|uniref:YcgN family cysteine cluster protein n=1 Tax=Saccharospirillum impatiens TaxID=169438 RepID=UPI000411D3F4|nr:YcgN family cysteine cluster protein [Saccharospirillum impatiens]